MHKPAQELEQKYARAQEQIQRLSEQVKRLTNTESELYGFQEALDQQFRIYRQLYEFGQRLVDTFDLDAILRQAVHFVLYELNFERCAVLIPTADATEYRAGVLDGWYQEEELQQVRACRFTADNPVVQQLMQSPVQCTNPCSEQCSSACSKDDLEAFARCLLVDEFAANTLGGEPGKPYGLIVVGNSRANFDYQTRIAADSEFMVGLGNLVSQVSNAINNIHYYRALEDERQQLEVKVGERTRELAQQNRELEDTLVELRLAKERGVIG